MADMLQETIVHPATKLIAASISQAFDPVNMLSNFLRPPRVSKTPYSRRDALSDLLKRQDASATRQRDILAAMEQLNAINFELRKNAREIARAVEGGDGKHKSYAHALSNLVKAKLIEVRKGSLAGYWMTSEGKTFADQLS